MYIEKDIFDNIIGTLMNIEGKTKDSLKTQLDLQENVAYCLLYVIE